MELTLCLSVPPSLSLCVCALLRQSPSQWKPSNAFLLLALKPLMGVHYPQSNSAIIQCKVCDYSLMVPLSLTVIAPLPSYIVSKTLQIWRSFSYQTASYCLSALFCFVLVWFFNCSSHCKPGKRQPVITMPHPEWYPLLKFAPSKKLVRDFFFLNLASFTYKI